MASAYQAMCDSESFDGILSVQEVNVITIDEIRAAQKEDAECQNIRKKIAEGEPTPYCEDERGLIIRIAQVDGAKQILIPKSLRQRALYIAHYTPAAGHPGVSRQFYTMRQDMYWPQMAADIREVSKQCHACCAERVKLRQHAAPMKLFPASGPLEFVAIDILGPLKPAAQDGSKFVLVMTDRFSKLTRALPLRSITALKVAKAFVQHWICSYGPPQYILSDNGSQFTSKLFLFVCAQLGIKNVFTATYHPQTNGQAERFNRTILAGIRAFCQDNLKSWPDYVGPLSYAYNTQIHTSTGVSPFQLVVSRPPGCSAIRDDLGYKDEPRARDYVETFRRSIKSISEDADKRLAAAQLRYKSSYDAKVRPIEQSHVGDWVYITREQPTASDPGDKPQKTKLMSKAIEPFQII